MRLSLLVGHIKTLLCIKKNREASFLILTKFGKWVLPNYRFTWPQMDWWRNKSFNEFLEAFDEDIGFNTHRRWALVQLMRLTENVSGDTAECGVYKGCSSWAMLKMNGSSRFKRTHHIFDSFEGVSEPDAQDGAHWEKGSLSAGEALVKRSLGEGKYRLYKGWIPSRFCEVGDRNFSFVHVDVDLYQPTKDSVEFFYERLNPGGIFLCDDYAFDTCPGATKAVDEFLSDKDEKMIALPDGGGFFIKGLTVPRSIF